MLPPNWFRYFQREGTKPELLNLPSRNVSSSFVSEITRTENLQQQ